MNEEQPNDRPRIPRDNDVLEILVFYYGIDKAEMLRLVEMDQPDTRDRRLSLAQGNIDRFADILLKRRIETEKSKFQSDAFKTAVSERIAAASSDTMDSIDKMQMEILDKIDEVNSLRYKVINAMVVALILGILLLLIQRVGYLVNPLRPALDWLGLG